MEEKKLERELMNEEEFTKYIGTSGLRTFEAVAKFKSVGRAIRRGDATELGLIAPKRPFNNRANTSTRRNVHSRTVNELKKKIYGQYKELQSRVA